MYLITIYILLTLLIGTNQLIDFSLTLLITSYRIKEFNTQIIRVWLFAIIGFHQ